MMVRAGIGLDPWDTFHQGLGKQTGWTMGVATIVVGAAVLLLWIPIRQRPGLGTVSNVVVIGVAMDASFALLPDVHGLALQIPQMLGGVVLNGVATGLYISARYGPGPRDGLMTGLHRRTGLSVRLVRTLIEITVLASGWVLGGAVGAGTVVYALAIGPLAQYFLRVFAIPEPASAGPGEVLRGGARRDTREVNYVPPGAER
ncbi:membrane protein [Streptomyces sp. CNQ-509]|nr:membrane protein [Streptomyces sp. CNQ-509]